jgi:predicted dinucleotide-binding enzyme
MQIAVLGTGMVGTTIATKLISLEHEVTLASRTADNVKARAWLAQVEQVEHRVAHVATFADATTNAELVFNCTAGVASLEALRLAGTANLAGKILIDLSNPLDFSRGMPPTLSICNDSSLGEQIQAAFPDTRVVKTLNTVNASLMVEPSKLPGNHVMFIAGNDAEAKQRVERMILREWFGWREVVDLGGIASARGTEMYLPLWLRMWGALGTANFNIAIVKG